MINHEVTKPDKPTVIHFDGDPYISDVHLRDFLGWSQQTLSRRLKKVPECVYDEFFNPTVISKGRKGRKLINLRKWRAGGEKLSNPVSKRKKKVITIRPKKEG